MAFNGSKNFKKNDVIRFFQSTGMQVGPDLDAATGYEETVYRFRIPTHRSEWIDRSLLVIEDWMTGLDFDEKEVDAERKVVVEE
ncbi:MAG: insulinase family protein [Proteobacteria bacterium]|nr:insulinase family protein [Pseudomonadota bacterium]